MPEAPLRVLLAAGRFEVRGSSAYTLRLAERLPAEGIEARIVTPNADVVEEARRARLRVEVVPHLDMPLWGQVVRESLLKRLKPDPPDLIHIQSWSAYSYGRWLSKRLERPFVLSIHDFLPPQAKVRFALDWGRQIIAVSQSVKSELLGRSDLSPDLIHIVHSGVDCREQEEEFTVLEAGRVPVVGTAGPLEAVKGHIYFLGAAQRVLASRPDVEFVIAGAGPEEENLRRVARELDCHRSVTFVSGLRDFSASLGAMDIFCLPSLRQGLGSIMLEAMALGRPVIASGVGGIYSVIRENQTGLVVPPSDSGRLSERILELLADPPRARAIGEAGRRLVQSDFSVDQMTALTSQIYRDAVGRTKPARTAVTAH